MYSKFKQRIRLAWDIQSPTQVSGGIRPQFQFGHPTDNRGLTIRERCRLQSFPDSFVVSGGIVPQAEQVMENIGAILKEAGTDYRSVLKTTCFLNDMNDFAAFNAVYAKYFTDKPARSCVAVKTLPKNVLCEVEVIAVVK